MLAYVYRPGSLPKINLVEQIALRLQGYARLIQYFVFDDF